MQLCLYPTKPQKNLFYFSNNLYPPTTCAVNSALWSVLERAIYIDVINYKYKNMSTLNFGWFDILWTALIWPNPRAGKAIRVKFINNHTGHGYSCFYYVVYCTIAYPCFERPFDLMYFKGSFIHTKLDLI